MSIPGMIRQRLPLLLLAFSLSAAAVTVPAAASDVAFAQDSPNDVCSQAWLSRLGPSFRAPTLPDGVAGPSLAGFPTLDMSSVPFAAAAPPVLGIPLSPDAKPASTLPLAPAAHAPSDLDDLDDTNQLVTRPNDPLYTTGQTGSLRGIIRAHEAWEVSFGAPDVTIAVVSDGIDLRHKDLVGKIWRNHNEIPANGIDDDGNGYVDDVRGWDFGDFDNDPSPVVMGPRRVVSTGNRGTMMAGIAAAETNNGYGIAGVSWGARIMPLKAMFEWRYRDRDGNLRPTTASYPRNMIESVCYAANNGARVVLLGGFISPDPRGEERRYQALTYMRAAVEYATQQGALVIAPTSECGVYSANKIGFCPDEAVYGENPTIYPAAFERVVAVASIDTDYKQRKDASYGPWVDITAPGEGLYTTVNSENFSDTGLVSNLHPQPSDFAAAHVAGAAALLWSANAYMSPLQVESQLCNTATRSQGGPYTGAPQRNDRFGCGVLHLERAMEQMRWQVDLPVDSLRHYITRDSKRPTLRIANHRLNDRTWEIRQDVPWIADNPLHQQPGQPSQLELAVNLEALPGGLAAGDRYTTVLRACPVNDYNIFRDDERDCRPYAPSGCTCLDYELVILDEVPTIYLPFGAR